MERPVAGDPRRPRVRRRSPRPPPPARPSRSGRSRRRDRSFATCSRISSPSGRGCQPPVGPALHAALASPGVTSITSAGSGPPRGSASRSVAVTIVCDPAGSAASSAARRVSSSSLSTSSRRRSGGGAAAVGGEIGLREDEREHGRALLALRAEAAQIPAGRLDPDVAQVRAERRRAARRSRSKRAVERLHGRRVGLVAQRRRRAGRAPRHARRTRARDPRRARRGRRRARRRGSRRAPSRERPTPGPLRPPAPGAAPRFAGRAPARRSRAGRPAPARGGRACDRRSGGARSGSPFTTASRSGTKTSADRRCRSDSTVGRAAPFTFARFGWPG